MTRSLKFQIVLIAILFATAGGLITHQLLFPPKPSIDNGIWIAARPDRPPATAISRASEAEYLAAQADAVSLQQRLEAAKHGIEEAVQMVKEQRDNFDFAEERYNRLMPLVEKGTLDLMTASQIQSAYIAARASLSQAKFYLGQTQREYGTPDTRKILLSAAQSKIEAARPAAGALRPAASSAGGQILAEIPKNLQNEVQPGTPALIFLQTHTFPAVVRTVDGDLAQLEPVSTPADLPVLARCKVGFIFLPK